MLWYHFHQIKGFYPYYKSLPIAQKQLIDKPRKRQSHGRLALFHIKTLTLLGRKMEYEHDL